MPESTIFFSYVKPVLVKSDFTEMMRAFECSKVVRSFIKSDQLNCINFAFKNREDGLCQFDTQEGIVYSTSIRLMNCVQKTLSRSFVDFTSVEPLWNSHQIYKTIFEIVEEEPQIYQLEVQRLLTTDGYCLSGVVHYPSMDQFLSLAASNCIESITFKFNAYFNINLKIGKYGKVVISGGDINLAKDLLIKLALRNRREW